MPQSNSWTILIPCHNKGPYVRSTFENVIRCFAATADVAILLIENGSRDETIRAFESLQSNNPSHQVTKIELRTAGLGEAVRATLPYVQDRSGWLVLHAGDAPFGTTDLEGYRAAIEQDSKPRVLVGSKLHPLSNVDRPLHRWLLTYLSFFARKMFFNTCIRDSQGSLCMPVELFCQLAPKTRTSSFFFNSELILMAEWANIPTMEIPVKMPRRQSKTSVRYFRDSYVFLRDLLAFRLRLGHETR